MLLMSIDWLIDWVSEWASDPFHDTAHMVRVYSYRAIGCFEPARLARARIKLMQMHFPQKKIFLLFLFSSWIKTFFLAQSAKHFLPRRRFLWKYEDTGRSVPRGCHTERGHFRRGDIIRWAGRSARYAVCFEETALFSRFVMYWDLIRKSEGKRRRGIAAGASDVSELLHRRVS